MTNERTDCVVEPQLYAHLRLVIIISPKYLNTLPLIVHAYNCSNTYIDILVYSETEKLVQ